MYEFITLDEAIKNCDCISNNSKADFKHHLFSAIELYKSKTIKEKILADRYNISVEADRDKALQYCDKQKSGIKTAKKFKSTIIKNDDANLVLINALNEYIENAEVNLKIEQPKTLNKGGQADEVKHSLGLSFKSVWEFHSKDGFDTPEAIQIATLYFYEAGIFSKPDSALEHNENCNTVRQLFRRRLKKESNVTPYLQVVKSDN